MIVKENKIFFLLRNVRIKAKGYIFKNVANDKIKKEYKGNKYTDK